MRRPAGTMNVRTTEVQAAVQQLVTEQGEYAPLELLLATNRLAWEDYRAWREGRLETLDAVLADGNRETREWLAEAQAWAHTLGLGAEPTVHHGWESNAGTVLAASVDSALNALLNTRFRHNREHAQLDLFLDSAQTAAVNELLGALTARDAGAARRALDRLVRIDRDHGQRFHAAKLISALEAPAPEGPRWGAEQLERMEREWVPAASALLGARRRDFLAPLWRDIGRALEPVPFNRADRIAMRAGRTGRASTGSACVDRYSRCHATRPSRFCSPGSRRPTGGCAIGPRPWRRGSPCVDTRPKNSRAWSTHPTFLIGRCAVRGVWLRRVPWSRR